jgi:hypothetical protein
MGEARISRRQFLRTSGRIVVSAAMVTGGGAVVCRSSTAWAAPSKTLDAHASKTLLKMSRLLYPSALIAEDQYARTVHGFEKKTKADAAFATLVREGVASLDSAAQGNWLDADDETSLRTLKGMEATPFFQSIRGALIGSDGPYNSPDVWKKFGYPGSSWQFGGYLGRGFGDIAWLPKE